MARKKICAGNWKMHKTLKEASDYFKGLLAHAQRGDIGRYLFFVPAYHLPLVAEMAGKSPLAFGAQNCHFEKQGAFTGELSPVVLRDFGSTHVLVGHSERRQLFGENNEFLAKKVQAAQAAGLSPMLCVGETLKEREANATEDVLAEQIRLGLMHADLSKPLCVAYEPVWAIGTGKVATTAQAQAAHAFIRERLDEMGGGDFSENVSILYGGSVKAENAEALSKEKDVDGFLVGGASLVVDDFVSICNKLVL